MKVSPIGRRTPLAELPELLRVEEAAAWLGCSKGVLYELARRDADLTTRIGRLLRVRRSALAAMAENGNGHGDA